MANSRRSSQSFTVRLTRCLAALVRQPDGRELLTHLAPDLVLFVTSEIDSVGLVTVRDEFGQEYRLFLVDVEVHSERLALQAA